MVSVLQTDALMYTAPLLPLLHLLLFVINAYNECIMHLGSSVI